MSFKHDLAVFIARAQIPHKGHLKIIEHGLQQAERVVVLLGSANAAISLRNPFPYMTRLSLMKTMLSEAGLTNRSENRTIITPMDDILYNDTLWVARVQQTVSAVAKGMTDKPNSRVSLIGHKKDETSYYLNLFPQWNATEVAPFMMDDKTPLSSTYLREKFLFPEETSSIRLHGYKELEQWTGTKTAEQILWDVKDVECPYRKRTIHDIVREEAEFARTYKLPYMGLPYPPTFTTVDAVVVQSGHVLLIERGGNPGRGLWALPGGFIQVDQGLLENCVRELTEETRLKVPEKVLRGSVVSSRAFDDPKRSIRGRTVTHAFLFKLNDSHDLPRVKAADDAKKAMWIPIGEIEPRRMYEDHYHILQRMLNRLEN